MQALVKQNSDGTRIWGYVVFEPRGWRLTETANRPFIFLDETPFESIDSLTGGQASKMGFELVKVDVEVKH